MKNLYNIMRSIALFLVCSAAFILYINYIKHMTTYAIPLWIPITLVSTVSVYLVYRLFYISTNKTNNYLTISERILLWMSYFTWLEVVAIVEHPFSSIITTSMGFVGSLLICLYLYNNYATMRYKWLWLMGLLLLGIMFFMGGYHLITGYKFFEHWRI